MDVKRIRYILRRTASAVMLAALFVLVLEVCARVDDWLRWDAPFFGDYSHASLRTKDQHGVHTRPGARYQKWQINSHGFRGPEITMEKPPGVIRIVVAGASEAFGLYENPGMEFPALLQGMLDENAPGRYQVLNAACPGMTPARIAFYFNSWISRFDPDFLIYYPTPAFYLDVYPPPAPAELLDRDVTPMPSETAWRPSLRLKGKVNVVRRRVLPQRLQHWARLFSTYRQVRRHPPDWVWRNPPPERIELFRQHVQDLIAAVQTHGTQVILATHGTRFGDTLDMVDQRHLIAWRRYYPRASGPTILAMEHSANEVVRSIGHERGLVVADVSRKIAPTADNYADFAHFTDSGSRLAAGVLAKAVAAAETENQR